MPITSAAEFGRHALGIIRNAPPGRPVIGLIDPAMSALIPEAREALASVVTNAYAAAVAQADRPAPAAFIMLSPMTHDPLFVARLLSNPAILRGAVVHDFIPRLFRIDTFRARSQRLGYATAMRWLSRCDLFLPNSRSPPPTT